MMRPLATAIGAVLWLTVAAAGAADEPSVTEPAVPGPSFRDVLDLPSLGAPRLAPGGPHRGAVLYTLRTADWEANRYDAELHLARPGDEPFELTRTADGSSTDARWSPDGRTIAFLADRGAGTQIHLIRADGGEARPLTAIEEGVAAFEFSPDGRSLALLLADPESDEREKRRAAYGKFAVEDTGFIDRHLFILDLERARRAEGGVERPAADGSSEKGIDADEGGADAASEPPILRRLTGGAGDEFTVTDFSFSPDGKRLVFAHQPDVRVPSFSHSDVALIEIESGEIRRLVEQPGYDGRPLFSPDGETVVFSSGNGEDAYYKNSELATVSARGGEITVLTSAFDEDPRLVDWNDGGIFFLGHARTRRQLYRLDPANHEIHLVCCSEGDGPRYLSAVDVAADGRSFAILADHGHDVPEIYRAGPGMSALESVTAMGDRLADWPRPRAEIVEWKSRDDTPIEGVLHKPADFVEGERYPLLVVIHGGPAALSRPRRIHSYVYPVEQWLAKGALVLEPNYRGSTGYGEAFRAKNVRNLGIGDAWDVLSGVDHLIELGLADPARLGAMGWSQGGYISAFLSTTSDRFKAISMGAGISNWTTYYVNTDIHPFTRHYLEATPWDDPDIYARTSPIHYIRQAKTPTLIQHGENDRRVPIPNAYELYQGLEDVGVEARLVVYQGFGHGISKPKERLAAVWHNWLWFARHLFEEDVELTAPLP